MSKEAMKLALDALEEIESYYGYDRSVGAMASSMYEASNLAKITSTRIREALAEQPPKQEPAGSVYRYGKDSSGTPWHGILWTASGLDLPDGTLIYTSPPAQRKPLTDEEIDKAWRSVDYTVPWEQHRIDIARAIEAAHGIKGDA